MFKSHVKNLGHPFGATASWTAAALCRFQTFCAPEKRQSTGAFQNLMAFPPAIFSWQPPKHRLSEHNLNQQQRESARDEPRKQLLELCVFIDDRLVFFQLVNFRVNLPELFRVVRA